MDEHSFDIGDMRAVDGGSIRYRIDRLAQDLALQLADKVSQTEAFRQTASLISLSGTQLYFEKRLKAAIYPVIRKLCVKQWYVQEGWQVTSGAVIWANHRGLGPALMSVWPDARFPLIWDSPRTWRGRAAGWIRTLSLALKQLVDTRRLFGARVDGGIVRRKAHRPTIAIHYTEGIDVSRRSELFWYPGSGVPADQVLIYFDTHRWSEQKRVPKRVLEQIETLGMKWVCLDDGRIVDHAMPQVWTPPQLTDSFLHRFRRGQNKPASLPLERWAQHAAEDLLSQVDYWLSFYSAFDVSVALIVEESGLTNVAQKIALDLIGGVSIGKQRSELMGPEAGGLGFHPNHVFFTWGRRGSAELEEGRNRIDWLVMTGYPHDAAIRKNAESSRRLRMALRDRGANWILAVFDNAYSREFHISKSMVARFYRSLIEWTLDDPTVGMLIKSKKPQILDGLPEIHDILAMAESTGRVLRLDDVLGRLPSEAAMAADISVGLGISSAVMEAVIAGARGVHCDLSCFAAHPFYRWGCEEVIFNDLDRLMIALKRFKTDPSAAPRLGDFSAILDDIDPFRDGRAGERAGMFIRWLLEAFESGAGRESAILQVCQKYSDVWGGACVSPVRIGGRLDCFLPSK